MTTVYLIVRECDDPYYGSNPTRIAFTTEKAAREFIKSWDDDDEFNSYYTVKEIEITDDFSYAEKNLFKKSQTG